MKLNVDCIRDLLLLTESGTSIGRSLDFSVLTEKLPNYSGEEILYTALKLEEAGFILCQAKHVRIYPELLSIKELTYYGHQFLKNIRSDNNWNKIKDVSKKVGSTSLSALSEIASSVIAGLVKSQL